MSCHPVGEIASILEVSRCGLVSSKKPWQSLVVARNCIYVFFHYQSEWDLFQQNGPTWSNLVNDNIFQTKGPVVAVAFLKQTLVFSKSLLGETSLQASTSQVHMMPGLAPWWWDQIATSKREDGWGGKMFRFFLMFVFVWIKDLLVKMNLPFFWGKKGNWSKITWRTVHTSPVNLSFGFRLFVEHESTAKMAFPGDPHDAPKLGSFEIRGRKDGMGQVMKILAICAVVGGWKRWKCRKREWMGIAVIQRLSGGIAYKMISSMSGWPSLTKKWTIFFPLIDAPFQEKYCKRALPLVIFVGVFFWKISRQVETFLC